MTDTIVISAHEAVVDAARHAPSVHNTQPWRFVSSADGLGLWADPGRRLPVLDPDGHQLHLSCGAALQHARVAARALGLDDDAILLPDPAVPAHLAQLRLAPGAPATAHELALAGAVNHRHTDREAFTAQRLPDPLLEALRLVTEAHGARLRPVRSRDDLLELEVLLARADRTQQADPAYRQELAAWVRHGPSADGIPHQQLPADPERGSSLQLRDFQPGSGTAPSHEGSPPDAEHPDVVVIGTADDSTLSWLHAGQALGAVLLLGTLHGAAAQPLGQATDTASSRLHLGQALGMLGIPQLALRMGYPTAGDPTAQAAGTPRRALHDVLDAGTPTAPFAAEGPAREIVAAVWDSPEADATVRWAARQAAGRGARLFITTVAGWPGDTPPTARARSHTEATLARLASTAEQAHPELVPVTTQVLQGLPGPALVARSATAELLVVGTGTHGAAGHASSGSVAAYCTVSALCPTVVVPT